MSPILSRLLRRRKPTSANIFGQIEAQRAALADDQARAQAHTELRHSALDAGDGSALKKADDARDAAHRDAEIAQHALAALEMALTDAQAAEEREVFRAEVEAAQRAGASISDRIRTEYPRLSAELAALLNAIEQHNGLRGRLLARGKELGAAVQITEVEAFRREPPGGGRYRGLGYSDLISAIDLPGLLVGDDRVWPEPVPSVAPRGFVDTTRRSPERASALSSAPHDDDQEWTR